MSRINWGAVPIGTVLPFFFESNDGATGASETLSGLAVTDIEIYKNVSMTQRASDAGYALLDTDGIDIDGMTGINGFSVDTGDNTDAGFFAAGSVYTVVVASVTIDTQTVNFVAGTFRLVAAEGTAGVPVADATRWNNLATVALPLAPTTAGRTLDVSAGGEAGIDWANIGSPTTAQNLSGTNIDTDQVVASVSGAVGSVTGAVGSVTGAVGSVTGAVGSVASGGITEASFATTAGSFVPLGIIDQGTAQSIPDTTHLQLRAALALEDDVLIGATLYIVSATTGAGQRAQITDFVAATDTVAFEALPVALTGTVVYRIWATAPATTALIGSIADAVWDEALAGHVSAGSAGEALDAAGTAGDPWTTALPGAYGAGTAGKIIGDNINATISSRLAPTAAGRTLDVTAAGNAGIDWGNVENPTTAVNLSGTNIDTDQVVASVTGAVGSVTGAVGSVTGAVGSVTGNVGGNVTGSVGSLGAQAKLDVNAEADTALADSGINPTDGVGKIAGVDLQQGGTGGQLVGA